MYVCMKSRADLWLSNLKSFWMERSRNNNLVVSVPSLKKYWIRGSGGLIIMKRSKWTNWNIHTKINKRNVSVDKMILNIQKEKKKKRKNSNRMTIICERFIAKTELKKRKILSTPNRGLEYIVFFYV